MHIVGAVLLCIALGYFRIWLVQHIFFKEKKKFSLALLATSVFLVASLYCFELVMQRIFPDLEVSLPWFGYFLLYCALIFLFLLFLNKNYQSKHLWFLFCVRLIMFAIVGVLGFKVGMGSIVIYYLISAYAEEFLKIWASENATNKTTFFSSDLLSFSILVALGFSIVENFFYLGKQAFGAEMGGMLSLAFGRGVFSSLIHLIATGTIALLLYKVYQSVKFQALAPIKKVVRVILCMLAGVVLHLGYNLAIGASQFWVYIVVVIGGYFLLSYIFFLSDSLYREEEKA